MNLKHHRDLIDREESSTETTEWKNTSNRDGSSSVEQPKTVEDEATGTVRHYDDDRDFGFVTTADLTRQLSDDESTRRVLPHL